MSISYDKRRLCELQAKVFELSLLYSEDGSAVFIRRFMRSDLARRLDTTGSLLELSDAAQMVKEVDVEFGGNPYGSEKYSANELHWMGYIYRYWCSMTGTASKAVYKLAPARELRSLYPSYHSLDPEQAVERICEAKGIPLSEEEEIRRGVEHLRILRV